MSEIERVLCQLRGVEKHNGYYQARCPAHDDREASLSVNTGKTGKILLKCHAGCSTEDVLKSTGLSWSDLYPEKCNGTHSSQIIKTYDYLDESGTMVFQVVRQNPKGFRQRRPDGKGGYTWNLKGVTPVLYHLPEVIKADQVIVVEGEKDADNVAALDLCATTSPMGAGKWRPHYNQWLKNKEVVILSDNDEPGRKHAIEIAGGLLDLASSVKVVELPGLKQKGDVSDWLQNGGSKESLLELVDKTPLFTKADQTEGCPRIETQSRFPLTDFGNAERFAAQHGANVRYCHTWGKWLIWSGKHWEIDETHRIFQLAKETVRRMYAEAGQTEDDEQRKTASKHARASEASGRIQAMLSLAQTEQSIAITGSQLDRNPWLLNVLNGTLDLRTGQLRPHNRQDLITKIAPVNYDQAATCPKWLAFSERVMAGSKGLIVYLQKFVGHCLTGDTREKCLLVLYGIGDNGKTIFVVTIGEMLGDYAQETPVETLMIRKQEAIPNDIARLKGARLVTASEGEHGQKLAESLIKRLTGGDKISARFLHQEWFEFTPEFKILLSTNHRPVIQGGGNAIWNRIHLVPFEVTIPKSEQIARTVMLEQLRQEWPGILKWAVDGCLLWQKEGLKRPEEVERATDNYRADSDIIGEFISDMCVLNPLAKCSKAVLRRAYENWCAANEEAPLSTRDFKSILVERGIKDCKVGAKAEKGWKGIGLKKTGPQDQTGPDFRVFSHEKNIQEKKVENRSETDLPVLSVTCSLCANFEPNVANSSYQGRCIGNPSDGERLKFPHLEHDCCEFRERGGQTCANGT